MFVKREDYERLVTQAAQLKPLEAALAVATERAVSAEEALTAERQGKDWLILQLASRVVTKHGGYGLDHQPHPIEQPTHPKGFTHEPSEIDLAKLEYYKECARQAGKDEDDAVMKWESEMRGDGLPMNSETEN